MPAPRHVHRRADRLALTGAGAGCGGNASARYPPAGRACRFGIYLAPFILDAGVAGRLQGRAVGARLGAFRGAGAGLGTGRRPACHLGHASASRRGSASTAGRRRGAPVRPAPARTGWMHHWRWRCGAASTAPTGCHRPWTRSGGSWGIDPGFIGVPTVSRGRAGGGRLPGVRVLAGRGLRNWDGEAEALMQDAPDKLPEGADVLGEMVGVAGGDLPQGLGHLALIHAATSIGDSGGRHSAIQVPGRLQRQPGGVTNRRYPAGGMMEGCTRWHVRSGTPWGHPVGCAGRRFGFWPGRCSAPCRLR